MYKIEPKRRGVGDRICLEHVFHKLLLHFTWWVNRKDAEGKNIFQGGFLGLDNIGVFDRSAPLPMGGHIEQSDGTAWMAMYCLNMLAIALELARDNPAYENVASKFFEHFVYIAHAMDERGGKDIELWDEADASYYDVLFLRGPHGRRPVYGGTAKFQHDPHWRDLVLFYEYFHGDNGAGIGASHQTGWTDLVAKLLQQSGE